MGRSIFLMAGRPRKISWRGICRSLLATVLLAATCAGVESAAGQSTAAQPWIRHHVIFLLDSSGSVLDTEWEIKEFRRVLRDELGPLLLGDNGFDVDSIFEPGVDASTSFTFGVEKRNPYFSPGHGSTFLRPMWVQERGRSFDDLAEEYPASSRYWTAYTAAFGLAVEQVRWELRRAGREPQTFGRTFLVMVTDGKANTTRDGLDEALLIHNRAKDPDIGHDADRMKSDREWMNATLQRLTSFYALRPALAGGTESGIPVGRDLKVMIRELVPHRLLGIDSLLARRPDRLTTLERRPGGRYAGTLQLELRPPDPEEPALEGAVSYDLQLAESRPPGSTGFAEIARAGAQTIDLPPLDLERDEVDGAQLAYRLSFRRQDPAYGQALVAFEDYVTFEAEPTAKILGILPVGDWQMNRTPGLTQAGIAVLYAWIVIFLMIASVLLLLYWLFFPPPKASSELLSPVSVGASSDDAVPVDFDLHHRGVSGGFPVILRILHFANKAERFSGLWHAERKFNVLVEAGMRTPNDVREKPGRPALGLSESMESSKELENVTHNSELTVAFLPAALEDYTGDWQQPVKCHLELLTRQVTHPWWKLRRSHYQSQETIRQPFYLRFFPESADVEVKIEPGVEPHPTGEVETRDLPKDANVASWLTVPHMRRREDDPQPDPQLIVYIRSSARRVCSRTCTACLQVLMYPADRSRILQQSIELDEQPASSGNSYAVECSDDGEDKSWQVSGIRYDPASDWPIKIPLKLNYNAIDPPPLQGDDYIVEIHLFPVPGETWRSQTSTHGVRLGPDPRRSEIKLEIAPAADGGPVWRTYDPKIHGKTMRIDVSRSMSWSVARDQREQYTLALLRVDNLARTGPGRVELELLPKVTVESGQGADLDLEPTYVAERGGFLKLAGEKVGGYLDDIKDSLRWTLDTSREHPVDLQVLFEPSRIERMPRGLRLFPYRLFLPFRYRLYQEDEDAFQEHNFEIVLDFQVERYTGEYVLAIDFGTSAIVTVFAESMANALETGADGASYATLNLQARYLEVLAERDQQEKEQKKGSSQVEEETRLPNQEKGTVFIPSHTLWRPGKTLGEADFVYLPSTISHLTREWGRAVYFLKGLILRGDQRLPKFQQLEVAKWIDEATGEASEESPLVDGLLRSAYGNLLKCYIKPLIREDRREMLDKLVFAHPNNFTLSHKDRLRKVLGETLGEGFRIDFLSESQAVALYCAYRPQKYMPGALSRKQQYVMVYDIGAGTLDLTYARLKWDEKGPLREVEILFQTGKPVAGNSLDIALARVIDSTIRYLQKRLRDVGITLDYTYPIVGLDDGRFDVEEHLGLMYPIKQAIHNLKMDLTKWAEKKSGQPFTVQVPIDASPDIAKGILTLRGRGAKDPKVQRALDALKIRHTRSGESEHLHLPIESRDVVRHAAVVDWMQKVSDDMFTDLAGALHDMGQGKPSIDTLIISGRTSKFPPLRDRVLGAIEEYLKIPRAALHIPEFQPAASKEVVALGALAYSLMNREGVRFADRNVWAKYGLIYETGMGRRFEEFFGYGTPTDHDQDKILEKEGVEVTLFRRTREIHWVGGPVEVAVTYSHDPDADLDKPGWRDKFTIIKSLGANYLGAGPQVKVRMSIDEDDHLKVVIDPDGFRNQISDLAYQPAEHLPQLDWPYKKLDDPIELERATGERAPDDEAAGRKEEAQERNPKASADPTGQSTDDDEVPDQENKTPETDFESGNSLTGQPSPDDQLDDREETDPGTDPPPRSRRRSRRARSKT